MSFAHPGWSNQKETGRLITLRFGTIWGLLGPFGAIWDHMGPFGVILDKNDKMTLSDLWGPLDPPGTPMTPHDPPGTPMTPHDPMKPP